MFPCVGLVISGGHTALVRISDYDKIKLLGQTRDDAAGEAFDKVAKVLNLGYPGGPAVEKEADKGAETFIDFPKAYLEKGSLDFSFSGIKTAVIYYLKNIKKEGKRVRKKDIAASFQKAVFDVIIDKSILACKNNNAGQLLAGGGVTANRYFQKKLKAGTQKQGIEVIFPAPDMCTDNAAMIAGLGFHLYKKGLKDDYTLTAEPYLGI